MPGVTVRFFATYREITGVREREVPVSPDATVGAVVEAVLRDYPALARHQDSMLIAVNQEFCDPDRPLRAGDEVALLPPVSGGAGLARVQEAPIDGTALVDAVRDARAGAIVLFLGTVRADPGVRALDYEAYDEMALRQLETLRASAKERFHLTEIAIVHRTGLLPVGQDSVAVACSASHRREAFEACAWAMEELKRIVPVWKAERGGP